MWCQHPVYQRVAIRALNADITFIGIGEVELGGPLNAEGFITDARVQALKSQHVAGEMLGHFINHYGERLASELDALLTSVR